MDMTHRFSRPSGGAAKRQLRRRMIVRAETSELIRTIHHDPSLDSDPKLIIDGCAKAIECAGVALTWSLSSAGPITIAATDGAGASLELADFILDEGPQTTCINTNQVILRAKLTDDPAEWAGFTPEALRTGVTGIFAFPLRLDGRSLGALTLYRRNTQTLNDLQFNTALAYAEVAVALLMQPNGDKVENLPPVLLW